jgi:glucokinase
MIGVDVGGSKVLVGLAMGGGDGPIVDRERIATEADKGGSLLERVFAAIDRLLSRNGLGPGDLCGLGVVVPGPVSPQGIVLDCANIPALKGLNLKAAFSTRYGVPVGAENDAHAAALAEARVGAGRPYADFIYLSLGTGIGGGIILGHRLHRGVSGVAGELSHIVFPGEGSLHTIASGKALLARFGMDAETLSARLGGGKPDQAAEAALDHLVRYIGAGLANLVTLLNPEAVVVGGGLCNLGDRLLAPLEAEARTLAFSVSGADFAFVRAELADDSGVVGAIQVCRDQEVAPVQF